MVVLPAFKRTVAGSSPATPATPNDPRDFSKLRIVDGVIHYKLYQQDGSMVDMTVKDTHSNRLFVSWVQIHDRY
jgi:hypothetical protein